MSERVPPITPEFESDLGRAIRGAIAPGSQTVLVVGSDETILTRSLLDLVVVSLERHGIGRGRQLLLAVASQPAEICERFAASMGRRLKIPALAHDRERSPCFVIERFGDGHRLEVNDELREAEAIVFMGPVVDAGHEPEVASREFLFRMTRGISHLSADSEPGPGRLVPDVSVVWNEHGIPRVLE